MNISTRQLRAFLQVVATGSFTRAAERAHMTQAGLSILIRELERQVGTRLFDRTTRTVDLTVAGRRFEPVARRTLLALDDLTDELGALGSLARQNLRIAATPLVSSQLLPQLLGRFGEHNPGIHLTLLDASLDAVNAMVAAGEADLGLGFFFSKTPGITRAPVARFPLMRVGGSDKTPERIGRTTWASLRAARLIGLPPDNPIQKVIDAQLGKLGIIGAQTRSVNFFGTLIAMVEAGFGTAIMPTFAMSACRRHKVRMDLLGSPSIELTFYRISKRGTAQSDPMIAFSETLIRELPTMSQ